MKGKTSFCNITKEVETPTFELFLIETISEMMRRQEQQQEAKVNKQKETQESKEQVSTTVKQQELHAESSVLDSPQHSPDSSGTKPHTKSIKLENLPFSSCGMLDRTRVALCSFLFAFLLVSPLNYLLPQLGSGN